MQTEIDLVAAKASVLGLTPCPYFHDCDDGSLARNPAFCGGSTDQYRRCATYRCNVINEIFHAALEEARLSTPEPPAKKIRL